MSRTTSSASSDTGPPILVPKKEPRATNTGTKAFPICNDAGMKEVATSTEELTNMCFPEKFSLIGAPVSGCVGSSALAPSYQGPCKGGSREKQSVSKVHHFGVTHAHTLYLSSPSRDIIVDAVL